MIAKDIPLSLYVHIPWCEKKCPYCDFNSHTLLKSIPEKDYIASLFKDIDEDKNKHMDTNEIVSKNELDLVDINNIQKDEKEVYIENVYSFSSKSSNPIIKKKFIVTL